MAAAAHSPGFLALVEAARREVREISAADLRGELEARKTAALIDVREESEYAAGHVQGAEHLGKGVIERDIETRHPDRAQPLYLYCGGGFRSALAAQNLQRMGYTQVTSVDGGWKALKDLLPTTR
ncbi:rhodanese-related sulfurtransferase [Panacagrimonas perspica]|uniref:Rhodanese-related sulfurtransferase n=1 Tax=Panacagrimonas perspica TaxID=381431 RepID=A0A4R7PB43_9GAMM|nr:rhodanese-like domain-containing protein [Panacagrimonas perspica]TDU30799.1 rhodanese-related sulfurtransferase [Panacagrimonas perspica]THD01613.1 sulfurtransferase [Panacagrimonas perspica]